MNLDRVAPGSQLPEEVNVIIEIPMYADPVRHGADKDTGALFVDRFVTTAMHDRGACEATQEIADGVVRHGAAIGKPKF
jgi:inorganic pyrophosphatase